MPAQNAFTYTTQAQLRAAFREQHPELDFRKRKISHPSDTNHNRYPTDTRCAFVDWIDYLERDGQISKALAERATL